MAKEYVVIDLETTGLDIMNESIIEIAAVKVKRGLIVDSFSTLVACDTPLRPEIELLTGITTEMLAGQPELDEVLPQLEEFVGEADIAAHNAEFDSTFLHRFWADGRQWLDTITLAQIAWPCFPSYSLANLCAYLDIDNEAAHRALGDAMATAQLLIAIEKQLDALPITARQDILKLCEGDDSPTAHLLRRKCGQPGEAAAGEGKRPDKPAPREIDEDYRIDLDQISSCLGPDSSCAERIEGFEERPQQLKMSLAVAKAFNNGGRLLVEAGTGTGKSLAYLLPAALFSQGSGAQVAVSTHTRNLQEQLLNKDIPMLSRLLDRPVKAAVIKGRSNYLCRRLYQYLLNNPQENLRYFLMRVAVWRSLTRTGDGGELTLTSYDRWKWQRVCASRENCAPFCPFSRRGGCIVQRVRSEATAADIIIVNHSLLIANAAIEKGFLPDLPYLVIDEAQHLEGAAEDQLTSCVDIFSTLDLLGRLTRRERGRAAGALATLRRHLPTVMAEALLELAQKQLDSIENDCEAVIQTAEGFFDLLASGFRQPEERISYFPHKVRILPRHRESAEWQLILEQGESFGRELENLSQHCFRLLDLLNDGEDSQEQERLPGSEELYSAANLSRELAGTVAACLQDNENYVAWVEFPDATKKPSVNIAPIELGELLDLCLYQEKKSLVMTSATLAAGRDFSYFKHRVGLDRLETAPAELVMSSPFHYRDQALFTVVNDLPDWSRCSEVTAIEAISAALIRLLSASRGRAIVLFTSHFQLKSVFEHIKQPLAEQGVTVLAHGVSGAPSGLLARLKAEEKVCILGANSFWEGVDVSGSALSLLVVVRLPFWPPNTPIAQSRMERIEAEGRSPFNDYSLPQALIRFKQGFGRLIRSDQDSGVFCVLDRRIVEKYYGARFIRALPDMRRVVGSTEEIAEQISRCLG
ncbi:MAG: DEAD/DEAH box helicase [Firmicutes bacterium]|nr:DEAD/DEAH box helicase [Bacillota bacterium]